MNIEWKEINPDYIVSSDGQVGSRKSGSLKMLKPYAESKGYLQIQLCDGIGKKARMVHRLVAEAFLPPQPTSIHQINHKNGIKADNRVCNLEWVTPKENTRHRFEVLNQKMPRGEDSHQAKLTAQQVLEIRSRRSAGELLRIIAADFGITKGYVGNIYARRKWGWLSD